MTATTDTAPHLVRSPLCGEPLPLDGAQTLPQVFARTAARFADDIALRTVGEQRTLTWSQYRDRVADVAGGLAGLGVRRGDSVGLMLANRPEFFVVDTAAQYLGAAPFSVYNTSSAEQVGYLFSDADNRVVVTERQFLPVAQAALALGGSVEHIVVIDGAGDDGTLTLDDLVAAAHAGFDLDEVSARVEPGDVATLIYTSGTTGPPKGVELTHANLVAQWNMLVRTWPIKPGGRVVSYLPAAHIADRHDRHLPGQQPRLHRHLLSGPVPAGRGPRRVPADDLPRGAPGVGEAQGRGRGAGRGRPAGVPGRLRRRDGRPPRTGTGRAGRHRARRGDRAPGRRGGGGGAGPAARQARPRRGRGPAGRRRAHADAGTPVLRRTRVDDGRGMGHVRALADRHLEPAGKDQTGHLRHGAPGGGGAARRGRGGARPGPDRDARLPQPAGEDRRGRGRAGLHALRRRRPDRRRGLPHDHRPQEGADHQQRRQEHVARQHEAALKSGSPLIGQAVCFGDARPYNVAILVLDAEAVPAFAAAHGLDGSDLAAFSRDPAVIAEVGDGVARANATLSRIEQIKRWKLLAQEWLPAGDELTPTSKLRRKPIAAKYAADIEALYAG